MNSVNVEGINRPNHQRASQQLAFFVNLVSNGKDVQSGQTHRSEKQESPQNEQEEKKDNMTVNMTLFSGSA